MWVGGCGGRGNGGADVGGCRNGGVIGEIADTGDWVVDTVEVTRASTAVGGGGGWCLGTGAASSLMLRLPVPHATAGTWVRHWQGDEEGGREERRKGELWGERKVPYGRNHLLPSTAPPSPLSPLQRHYNTLQHNM